MTYQDAIRVAHNYRNKTENVPVCIRCAIPRVYGWWFEFETVEYMETADANTRAGDGANYPVFVSKSGEIWNVVGPYNPRLFFEEYEAYVADGKSQWMENLAPFRSKAE